MLDSTTLLIQGLLKKDTFDFYQKFYPKTKKIFSTWEDCSLEHNFEKKIELDYCIIFEEKNSKLIKIKYPKRFSSFQNFDLQITSTAYGLMHCKTKFTIKLRGDEWYSNLHLVEQTQKSDEEVVFFAPIFFRKWDYYPFHISDHLISAKTSNLKMMIGSCLRSLLREEKQQVAESFLGKCYLEAKNNMKLSDHDELSKDIFKQNFGLIDLELLKYYKVKANLYGKIWYSNFEDHDSISSMSEL